jgi:hypothetical protein
LVHWNIFNLSNYETIIKLNICTHVISSNLRSAAIPRIFIR